MSYAEQEAALEQSAAPVLAAIEEDERRAPSWLQPLFAAARDLLFYPDLKLEQIQQAAGFSDAEVWNAMREETGQPAWDFLRDARLETGANLLLRTEMSIAEIGRLVGYTSGPSFRRLLGRFLGMPPSRYRERARRRLDRAGPLPAGADSQRYWERMQAGELTGDEARELDAYLGRLAPDSAPATPCDDRWTRLRQSLADGLLETLDPTEPIHQVGFDGVERKVLPGPGVDPQPLSFDDQRRLVRDAAWFPDGTLFEALSRRGAQADSRRGLELAILGVDYLATSRIPEVDPRLVVLAWARLARARWRDGDLEGARRELDRTDHEADLADPLPPFWEAERNRIAAAFDWYQGRRQQALELASRSVAAYRASGDTASAAGASELAAALVLRAELRAAAADLDAESAGARMSELRHALTDLEEALDLLAAPNAEGLGAEPVIERGRRQAAVSLQIRLLATIGTRAEITAALPATRRAAEGLDAGLGARLRWLEGHADGSGEAAWRQARDDFARFGDEPWLARVTLDLARLCLDRERTGEAAALASELASTLGPLASGDSPDLEALARAAPFGAVTGGDLDLAEGVLGRLEWRRRAERALALA